MLRQTNLLLKSFSVRFWTRPKSSISGQRKWLTNVERAVVTVRSWPWENSWRAVICALRRKTWSNSSNLVLIKMILQLWVRCVNLCEIKLVLYFVISLYSRIKSWVAAKLATSVTVGGPAYASQIKKMKNHQNMAHIIAPSPVASLSLIFKSVVY